MWRRLIALVALPHFLCAAAAVADITSASLEIQGAGLRLETVSVTTGLDIPTTIQTSLAVKQLTPEEIRARGIVIDERNYDVYGIRQTGRCISRPHVKCLEPAWEHSKWTLNSTFMIRATPRISSATRRF